MLSFHTSPLAQPGVGDSGGMNVYVRELVAGLAHAGVEVTTYTREWRAGLPREILVEPNHRVIHIPAGQFALPKEELESLVPQAMDFIKGVLILGNRVEKAKNNGTVMVSVNIDGSYKSFGQSPTGALLVFDNNPNGRILNRLSSDVTVVDTRLPWLIHVALESSVIFLGFPIGVAIYFPWMGVFLVL